MNRNVCKVRLSLALKHWITAERKKGGQKGGLRRQRKSVDKIACQEKKSYSDFPPPKQLKQEK